MDDAQVAVLHELAKRAAEKAGKNASVAPHLLFAHIYWALQDAERKGRIVVPLPPARPRSSDLGHG